MSIQNNKLIKLALDEYVEGHEEAKKALIVMLARSRMRAHQKYVRHMEDEYLVSPLKILLIGKSGTGKTHLLHSLQQIVHFPIVKLDSTHLNPAGAGKGIKIDDVHEAIVKEATNALMDYPWQYMSLSHAVNRTVVFLDEFDKLGNDFESSGNWNKHVQSNFLTLFDNKDEWEGLSFVFAGAFSDSVTKKKEQKNQLGFTQNNDNKTKEELLDLQVLKAGLIPEIVGRINTIVTLDTFTKEDYYKILKGRILPKKILDLAAYHVFENVDIDDELLMHIAEQAEESEQGVRYLHRAVDKYFLDIEYECDVDGLIHNDTYLEE